MTADHDAQAAAFPCIRGCTFPHAEDAEPKPKGARHGNLCDSCFYRLTAALKLIPDLVANMRANLWGMKAAEYTARVSGGGGTDSPAPLNLGPLDASDALFAKLASWISFFAERFETPGLSIPSWANSHEIQGSRPVSVEVATMRAVEQVGWLGDRLESICGTASAAEFHDDITKGHDDARGVFSLSAAYGVKARPVPEVEKRECTSCGAWEMFVKTPNAFDDSLAVMCFKCGKSLPEHRKAFRAFMDAWEATHGTVEVEREARKVDHSEAVGERGQLGGQVLAGVALVDTAGAGARVSDRERSLLHVPGRPEVREPQRSSMKPFVAKFAGRCAGGCDGIEPGDVVQYEGDDLAHADCDNSADIRADQTERATATCTECWLIQPCGCGEF